MRAQIFLRLKKEKRNISKSLKFCFCFVFACDRLNVDFKKKTKGENKLNA